jgi:hypothetical protein
MPGQERAMTGDDRREPPSASVAGPALVRVTRPGHPLDGLRLGVWDRLRLRGQPFLVVVLPDGSKKQIPACWTSLGGQDSAGAPGRGVLAAPGDLLRVHQLICGFSGRAAGAGEQAARQSPAKEDRHAACPIESAAGPGSGATTTAGRPAARDSRCRCGADPRPDDHSGGAAGATAGGGSGHDGGR